MKTQRLPKRLPILEEIIEQPYGKMETDDAIVIEKAKEFAATCKAVVDLNNATVELITSYDVEGNKKFNLTNMGISRMHQYKDVDVKDHNGYKLCVDMGQHSDGTYGLEVSIDPMEFHAAGENFTRMPMDKPIEIPFELIGDVETYVKNR